MSLYTCKGKGGRYRLLGCALPAGYARAQRGKPVFVYEEVATGELFYRTEADFNDRMEKIEE